MVPCIWHEELANRQRMCIGHRQLGACLDALTDQFRRVRRLAGRRRVRRQKLCRDVLTHATGAAQQVDRHTQAVVTRLAVMSTQLVRTEGLDDRRCLGTQRRRIQHMHQAHLAQQAMQPKFARHKHRVPRQMDVIT